MIEAMEWKDSGLDQQNGTTTLPTNHPSLAVGCSRKVE